MSRTLSCYALYIFAEGDVMNNYYENHNLENKELPFVSHKLHCNPDGSGFCESNWHEEIELLCITGGDGLVFDDGEIISVVEGDIVVVNSNRLHTLAAKDKKLDYHYLIVGRSFCISNGFDTSKVTFETLIRDGALFGLMKELDEIYSEKIDDEYVVPSIRCLVLRIMLILLKKYSVNGEDETSEHGADFMKKTIEYIHASLNKDISLDEVADFVGVNKYRLSREFHKYAGCSFVEYVNHLRCTRAQKLLREGKMTVFEVARSCGFQNKSYFAKTFKRYVGALPSAYRKG